MPKIRPKIRQTSPDVPLTKDRSPNLLMHRRTNTVDRGAATIRKYSPQGSSSHRRMMESGRRLDRQVRCRQRGPRKEEGEVEQRYMVTVKFLVEADSAEDAEEMIESACEKAAASFPGMSYEGIEDIEEGEEE